MKRRQLLTTAAALPFAAGSAFAQGFPERPIRIIVPAPPAQSADTLARLMAAKITETTGHAVIVDNKPGGNMVIGASLAAMARPDGYTLLMSGTTASSAVGSLNAKPPYDPVKAFSPVVGVAINAYVLITRPTLAVRNVAELVAMAKQSPGKLTYGSGNESGRMAAELFKTMAGVDLLNVPYQGTSQALQDLVAGRVDMMFNGTLTSKPFVDNRQVNALGISSAGRDAAYPTVPPIIETVKDYQFVAWQALMAPAGVPQPVMQALTKMFTDALNAPDVKGKLVSSGLVPWPAQPDEVSKVVVDDLARWRMLVKEAKIPLEGR